MVHVIVPRIRTQRRSVEWAMAMTNAPSVSHEKDKKKDYRSPVSILCKIQGDWAMLHGNAACHMLFHVCS